MNVCHTIICRRLHDKFKAIEIIKLFFLHRQTLLYLSLLFRLVVSFCPQVNNFLLDFFEYVETLDFVFVLTENITFDSKTVSNVEFFYCFWFPDIHLNRFIHTSVCVVFSIYCLYLELLINAKTCQVYFFSVSMILFVSTPSHLVTQRNVYHFWPVKLLPIDMELTQTRLSEVNCVSVFVCVCVCVWVIQTIW